MKPLLSMTAALRCAAMDGGPDDLSWNEMAAIIGCNLRTPEIGDVVGDPMVTAALYWPRMGPE